MALFALRLLPQRMVHQHQRSHGFDHRDSAWQNAGIMAATGFETSILEFNVDGILLAHDRRHWFEGDAKMDGLTIGNAPLNATGAIRGSKHLAAFGAERIVVLRAREQNSIKA